MTGESLARHALELKGVSKFYESVEAVRGVDLTLQKGQLLALLGPSGCGKTTTLRLIAGFEQPDAGLIAVDGKTVAGNGSIVPPEKRRIGMVFQEYALFPHLTVAQNVAFGLPRANGPESGKVHRTLDLVGLAGMGHRMPHELSGGQQQRVALARALAPEPTLILLDEPFSNLDAGLRARVRAEVRSILKSAGATAVFVTHDQEEALSLVDRVAVMIHGQVRQVATPQQLYRGPADREVAEFIGGANVVPGDAAGRSVTCELGRLELQSEATGAVDVLVRPENVFLSPAGADGPARVRGVQYFGHDQVISVQLATGRVIESRMGPFYTFALGQPVTLRVTGPVIAYSTQSD